MSYGISTSCLYPMNTEDSLELLGKRGVKTCEVFLNSMCETKADFAKLLNSIKDEYGMKITAVHPFSSFSETFMLFSEYERRYFDVVDFYKRSFEVTAMIGADISIIHGMRHIGKLPHEKYFERFDPDLYDPRDWAKRAKAAGMNISVSKFVRIQLGA